MDPPPPPPPPHGETPKPSKSSGLPDGKYDIFVIPPSSAGSGFLYLPSLQVQRNSFLAGCACTAAAFFIYSVAVPVIKEWFLSTVNGGGSGVMLLMMGVGVVSWALGKTQGEGVTGGTQSKSSGSGQTNHPGGAAGASQGFAGSHPSGSGFAGGQSSGPGFAGAQSTGPGFTGAHSTGPGFAGAHSAGPGFAGTQTPGADFGSSSSAGPEFPGAQPRTQTPPPASQPPPPPRPAPQSPPPPKSSWQRPQPGNDGKTAWERAREETRKKEEDRRKAEEIKRRREELEKERQRIREKEVLERLEREFRQKKEQEEKEAAAKREKEEKEQQAQREKERQEREARERELREREERETKEREARERETREREERETRDREEKERLQKEREERAKRAASSTQSNQSKRPPMPSARTEKDDDAYSFRPYDRQKKSQKSSAGSVYSEDSYAPSATTAKTTPPASVRGPYATKDPDKIVIKAVYSFNNAFMRTPISQLVSGHGNVTDGLILRITTEGLFIDDDVRGVPQREWDIKAWTIKLAESCEINGMHVLRASIRDQEGRKYVFILSQTEGWKVAVGLQRLRKGTQVRAMGVTGMPQNEAKALLENLGWT